MPQIAPALRDTFRTAVLEPAADMLPSASDPTFSEGLSVAYRFEGLRAVRVPE